MILTLTIGAPGCGKTSFAKRFVKETNKDCTTAVIVSKDDIRNMLSGSTNKQAYWKDIYANVGYMETAVRNMLLMCASQAFKAGIDHVIIPDCHPTTKSISYTLDLLASKKIVPTELRVVIFLENTLPELLKINESRPEEDRLSDALITDLYNTMQKSLKETKKYLKTLPYAKIYPQPKNPISV